MGGLSEQLSEGLLEAAEIHKLQKAKASEVKAKVADLKSHKQKIDGVRELERKLAEARGELGPDDLVTE